MHIGLDIDDVVADFIPELAKWHNSEYGTRLKKYDFKTYRLSEALLCEREEARERVNLFVKRKIHELKLISGAREAIERLAQRNNLVFITSRQPEIEEETSYWIKKNFQGLDAEVIFSVNHYLHGLHGFKERKTKAEICEKEKVDVMIEDSEEYLIQCHQRGIRVICFDQPWNQRIVENGIRRARNWREVKSYIGM